MALAFAKESYPYLHSASLLLLILRYALTLACLLSPDFQPTELHSDRDWPECRRLGSSVCCEVKPTRVSCWFQLRVNGVGMRSLGQRIWGHYFGQSNHLLCTVHHGGDEENIRVLLFLLLFPVSGQSPLHDRLVVLASFITVEEVGLIHLLHCSCQNWALHHFLPSLFGVW